MSLARLLRPELILLEMATRDPLRTDGEEPTEKERLALKHAVLAEFVELLERSGAIANRNKLLTDLFNREKRAGTGLKSGIAVPHVRTSHVKELVFAFARSTPGIDFQCLDGEPAHLFFILVAPPYDDTAYLKIYRKLATAFSYAGEELLGEFLEAAEEGEVLRAVRRLD